MSDLQQDMADALGLHPESIQLDEPLAVAYRYAREFAADEIRALAHRLHDNGDEAIEVALGGSVYVHRVLCDTAHALDGKP
jgi:hypothetical protein